MKEQVMTVSRNITNPPSDTDPIIAIANEIASLHQQIDELESSEQLSYPSQNATFDSEIHSLYHRIFAAQEELTGLKAQSVQGAMIQLAAASVIFNDVAENELDPERKQLALMQYRRLVYSAFPIICTALDIAQEDHVLPHFLEPYLDPWLMNQAELHSNVVEFPKHQQ